MFDPLEDAFDRGFDAGLEHGYHDGSCDAKDKMIKEIDEAIKKFKNSR